MANGKLLSAKDELTLRAMRQQLASMRRELDLCKRRRERAQYMPEFVGHGRITDADAIGGESNRWEYTGVRTYEDDTADTLTFEDSADEFTAQNLAEEHNNGSGQESNGVTVDSEVTLVPIMIGRVVRLYRRQRTGMLYFDCNNDVAVNCTGSGGASDGAVADVEEVLRTRLFE